MDPHLRGLAILYAATTAWALLFAGWGFVAAIVLRVSGIVATAFCGPRLLFGAVSSDGFSARYEIRAIPLPVSSIATAPAELEAGGEEWAEDDGEDEIGAGEGPDEPFYEPVFGPPPPPPYVPPPFSKLSFARRAGVLLGPFVLIAVLVAILDRPSALARLPQDAELLVRGALSPLGQGTDLARGFLRRLGEAPLPVALGMALRKQLAILLLPFWGGLWSTLLFVVRRDPARGRTMEQVALIGTLVQLGLILLWLAAIVRAVLS